jgi:periplasmic divalent cation tolerance protein
VIDRPAGSVAGIGPGGANRLEESAMGAALITVYTTFPDRETAARVTRALVEERLAACANLLPIQSIYRWRGRIEETGEWAALLKTRRDLYPEVEARLRALHPYEVPAILGSPDELVDPAYAAWVEESTGPGV